MGQREKLFMNGPQMDSNTIRQYAIESEIIGQLIVGVHYVNFPLQDHYQNRDVILTMSSGISFNLMQRDCYDKEVLYILKVRVSRDMQSVLDELNREQITRFAVKEVVARECWVSPFGMLLTNGCCVSVGASLSQLGLDVEHHNDAELMHTLARRVLPKE